MGDFNELSAVMQIIVICFGLIGLILALAWLVLPIMLMDRLEKMHRTMNDLGAQMQVMHGTAKDLLEQVRTVNGDGRDDQ